MPGPCNKALVSNPPEQRASGPCPGHKAGTAHPVHCAWLARPPQACRCLWSSSPAGKRPHHVAAVLDSLTLVGTTLPVWVLGPDCRPWKLAFALPLDSSWGVGGVQEPRCRGQEYWLRGHNPRNMRTAWGWRVPRNSQTMTVAKGSLSAENKVLLGLTRLTQKKNALLCKPHTGPRPKPRPQRQLGPDLGLLCGPTLA